ncbi:hypothetical protein BDV97DRAFT_397751 [Delphinella strobiligena]|nr:hypothetical protein BDV97DRAFT_397751 [Delphinella strobiligena]
MSINWVMLSPTTPPTFTPLTHEQTLYTSPPRTSLLLHSLNAYPGKTPFAVSSSAGTLYLTNRRIIYLPSTSTPQLQSFAAPILNTHDSHVVAPWIGPNVWTALVQPVQGGGIPPTHATLELKVTFKEGGAYDFHSRYERVKERLQQAVEVARESGNVMGDGSETGRGRGGGALAGVNVAGVHLEDLPAYEESGGSVAVSVAGALREQEREHSPPPVAEEGEDAQRGAFTPPAEPPPGYEEVQRETIQDEVERRLSGH